MRTNAKMPQPQAIGLPAGITALLFDLDGVITRTADIHAAAWKQTFDDFLSRHSERTGQPYAPFGLESDYAVYVDGKPRYDGVRSFLDARGITLREGAADDSPGLETVCGIGNRKNIVLQDLIAREGVEVFPGTLRYLEAAKDAGMRRAVVSSSANCRAILESCDLLGEFEEIMDGKTAAIRGLAGKPAPDTYLAAASDMGVSRESCTVFEDALAGVSAAKAGRFGFVVGVDRADRAPELLAAGADHVVQDLAELIR